MFRMVVTLTISLVSFGSLFAQEQTEFIRCKSVRDGNVPTESYSVSVLFPYDEFVAIPSGATRALRGTLLDYSHQGPKLVGAIKSQAANFQVQMLRNEVAGPPHLEYRTLEFIVRGALTYPDHTTRYVILDNQKGRESQEISSHLSVRVLEYRCDLSLTGE